MAGSQKVFLRIVGIVGDTEDADKLPDRVPVSGSGRLVPTLAAGSGDVAPGPDAVHEVRLVESIPFLIVDGMLSYDSKPYVWITVPTSDWQWRVVFDRVQIGDQLRELASFAVPLSPATPEQIADPDYPGVNLAQYGIGSWAPGTVSLTANAIQQITIMLGRASNSALAAEAARDVAVANGLRWRGQWEHGTGYVAQDAVSHEGSSWRALSASTGSVPGSGSAWVLLAARGGDGASSWDQVSEKPGSFPSTIALVVGLQDALDDKADVGHKHPVSDLNMTGAASSTTFARGDGTWATPPNTNTTYSVPSQAEAEAGTATTARAFSAQRVAQAAIAASGKKDWQGTQAQYDALGTKESDRTYWIV